MDQRIQQLQADAEHLARQVAEANRRLEAEIALLAERIEAVSTGMVVFPPSAREALDQCERERELLRSHSENLERHIETMRNHLATAQTDAMEARNQYSGLRDLVVRYAVACAAVDLQQAMLRRDPQSGRETLGASLRQALQDERTSSDALRAFARQVQAPIDRG